MCSTLYAAEQSKGLMLDSDVILFLLNSYNRWWRCVLACRPCKFKPLTFYLVDKQCNQIGFFQALYRSEQKCHFRNVGNCYSQKLSCLSRNLLKEERKNIGVVYS